MKEKNTLPWLRLYKLFKACQDIFKIHKGGSKVSVC